MTVHIVERRFKPIEYWTMIAKFDFVAETVEASLSTYRDLVHFRSRMKTSEDPSGMKVLCPDMAKAVPDRKPHGAQKPPSREIAALHAV
ncbi:MAG: hypothetical protein EAX87_06735 [Candidatus Thorarchaeota archaeon]|nr:hypothetical protein [Candidatus Thorarchaeota archaeon]